LARVSGEHDALQYTHQETVLSLKATTERNEALDKELDALSSAALVSAAAANEAQRVAAAASVGSTASSVGSAADDEHANVILSSAVVASMARRNSEAMVTELSALHAELASAEAEGAEGGDSKLFGFGVKAVAEKALALGRSLQSQMDTSEERHAEEVSELQNQLLATVSKYILCIYVCSYR
jgi:hypothetical protein